jgi:hypothetical protein
MSYKVSSYVDLAYSPLIFFFFTLNFHVHNVTVRLLNFILIIIVLDNRWSIDR